MDHIKQTLDIKEIKPDHLPFYYTDKNTYCCDINLPLMHQVEDFDYVEPIKYLTKYYGVYYNELLDRIQKQIFKPPIYINDHHYDLDEMILQYCKCIKDMSLMVVWPVANVTNIQKTKFYFELEQNGKVHAIKEMVLSRSQLNGVIYQTYYNKSGFKSMDAIKGKAAKSRGRNHVNRIFVIFYKANNFSQISGKNAPLKVKLRESLREDSPNKTDKLNFFLHVTDNHTEVVELAQLFCNKNSMRIIHYQRLDRILYGRYAKSIMLFMTYKNFLYQKIRPTDHIRFMLFSSAVLASLGARNANDIDLIVHHDPTNTKTDNFFKTIHHYLGEEETKMPIFDLHIQGFYEWSIGGKKEYLFDWFGKEWPNSYGSKSMGHTIFDPKYHYYYFGIKIISFKAFLKRRIKRARPSSYADLYAMKQVLNVDFTIPSIPQTYWKFQKEYVYTEQEIKVLYKKIVWYLRRRYGLKVTVDDVKKLIK